MDVSEFEDLIDRLGEDMSRWPDSQRVAGEELLASSREARTLLVGAPAGLADRIVTAASKLNTEAPRADDETATDSVGVTQSG